MARRRSRRKGTPLPSTPNDPEPKPPPLPPNEARPLSRGQAALEDRQFQAVLAEYASLRKEIVATIDLQTKALQLFLFALAAVYGFLVQSREFAFLPMVGVVTTGFVSFYILQGRVVTALSHYVLEEIERKKIPALTGQIPAPAQEDQQQLLPIGWQHQYQSVYPEGGLRWFKIVWYWCIFGGLGFVPAVAYDLLILKHLLCAPSVWIEDTLWDHREPLSLIALSLLMVPTGIGVWLLISPRPRSKRVIEGSP